MHLYFFWGIFHLGKNNLQGFYPFEKCMLLLYFIYILMTLSCKTEIAMLTPDTQETEFTQFVSCIFSLGKSCCRSTDLWLGGSKSCSIDLILFLFLFVFFRGCLTQEKIVAACAKQFIIIADDRSETKFHGFLTSIPALFLTVHFHLINLKSEAGMFYELICKDCKTLVKYS